MLIRGDEVFRIGGTALGGGTLFGLGAALTGSTSFDQVIELASGGDRRNVDLLVSDIYPSGELPLPGDLNAASFAKLANHDIADHLKMANLSAILALREREGSRRRISPGNLARITRRAYRIKRIGPARNNSMAAPASPPNGGGNK